MEQVRSSGVPELCHCATDASSLAGNISSTLQPPVPNLKVPFDSKGYTHTHASPKGGMCDLHPARKGGRHMCTQKGQMKMKRTRQTKVCEVAGEKEPSEEGQPMSQTSL